MVEILVENGIKIVVEGVNMLCIVKVVFVFYEVDVWYCLGKVVNVGGVVVFVLEMS